MKQHWAVLAVLLLGCEQQCFADAHEADSFAGLSCVGGRIDFQKLDGKLWKVCVCPPAKETK